MQIKTKYHHFKNIYSTNTWALQNVASFDKEAVTIVSAESQSTGRGRQGRQWESPPDANLYMTFCFFVDEHNFSIPNIPQVLALSCTNMLSNLGLTPQLKWPNDILINGKKIAGILCETRSIDNQRFLALGIGLNINMPQDIINHIDKPSTSIEIECGIKNDVKSIQVLLEECFLSDLEIFFKKSFTPFLQAFKDRLFQPEKVQFSDNNQLMTGKIISINADGTLTLEIGTGEMKTFNYGEII